MYKGFQNFLFFQKKKVDFIRFDYSNVCRPCLSFIVTRKIKFLTTFSTKVFMN